MAITPEKASQLTPEQIQRIDFEDRKIEGLLQGMDYGEVRKVPMPTGLSDRQYNELKARYTSLGWNIDKGTMTISPDDRFNRDARPYTVAAWLFTIANVKPEQRRPTDNRYYDDEMVRWRPNTDALKGTPLP